MQAIAAPQDKELVYYPPAAIRVHESVSPPIKNRSHELIAEVEIPENGDDGMLVTAGGRTAGYALFIKGGRLALRLQLPRIAANDDHVEGRSSCW